MHTSLLIGLYQQNKVIGKRERLDLLLSRCTNFNGELVLKLKKENLVKSKVFFPFMPL